jgi:hypothetical protein
MWRIGSNLEDGKEVDGCWLRDGKGYGKWDWVRRMGRGVDHWRRVWSIRRDAEGEVGLMDGKGREGWG